MNLRRPSVRAAAIGAALAAYLVITATFALRVVGPDTLVVVSGVSLALFALVAGAAGLIRGRATAEPRTGAAWLLLGGACTVWGVGQSVTLWFEVVLRQEVPFPSAADVGYLAAVPFFAAGLLCLAVPASHLMTRLRAILDGLIIACALLLVGWVAVLGPVARVAMGSVAEKAVLLAYPIGDVVILTLVTYVVLRARATGARPPVPLTVIGAGLVGFATADIGFAYLSLTDSYVSGSVIDAGWLAGFTLIAIAAAMRPRQVEVRALPESRPLGVLLPYAVVTVCICVSVALTELSGRLDGTTVWIRSTLVLLIVARQVLTLHENSRLTTTLERRVEARTAELRHSQQRFRAMVEHSSDVVTLVRPDGTVGYQSDAGPRVLGHDAVDLLGRDFGELLDEPSRSRFVAALADAADTPLRTCTVELRLLHGDGGWRQIETTITNLLAEPAVDALVLNSRDVSERRELEDQLVHQAFHDPLTGLANRALFHDRVAHALRRRGGEGEAVAVVFLDLDGFKEINDSLGHAAGDALLATVARRVESCVTAGDTLARLGGDEFAVLVEGTTLDECVSLAQRVQHSFEEPTSIEGRSLVIRASIGIAVAGHDHGDPDELVRNADLAMYQAKERRDGEIALYDPSMHASVTARLELEADMRTALRTGQFRVHYQPTVTIDDGRLVAAEALLRWTHPERGDVPPAVFIPVAEQSGLIHDLGRFVLEEACAQAVRWDVDAPEHPLSVGVNVSGKQLQRPRFADEVRGVLEDSGLPPHRLVLEMTESILMDDTDTSVATLQALKALGVRIAIDDFGTGYSSLSYLHRFPVDILKIDRSFIDRLAEDDAPQGLVQSILQLGRTLRLETVAEGIERDDQLVALQRLGCDLAQGYHFGRPGPPDAVLPLLTAALSAASSPEDPAAAPVPGPRTNPSEVGAPAGRG